MKVKEIQQGIKGEVMEVIGLINKLNEERINTKQKSKDAGAKMAKLMIPIIQRCYEIAWSFQLDYFCNVGLSDDWFTYADEDDFTFIGMDEDRLEFVVRDCLDSFYIPVYCLEGDFERFFDYCKDAKTKELGEKLEELEKKIKAIGEKIYTISVRK